MTLLLDRFELGSVELLVEIRSSFIGETVETARDALDETIRAKLREPITCVITNSDLEVLNGPRCQVPLIPHELQDLIIDRLHPVRSLSHGFVTSTVTHISSGVSVNSLQKSIIVTLTRFISL